MRFFCLALISTFLMGAGGDSAPKKTPPPKDAPAPTGSIDEVQALIDAKKYAQASKKALVLIKQSKDPRAYNLLGLSYRKQNKHKQAIKAYQQATKLAPKYWQAYEYMGVALLHIKKPEQAKKIYKVLQKRAPRLASMLKNEAKKLGYEWN